MNITKTKYKNHFLIFIIIMYSLVILDWFSMLSQNDDSPISRTLRLFLIIYLFVFVFVYVLKNRLKYSYFSIPLLLMMTIIITYTFFSTDVINNFISISKMVLWFLGFFYIFILLKNNAITFKKFRFFIFSMLVIMSILNIYLKTITTMLTGINGYSYTIVWCFPLMFMFKKSLKWYLVFGIAILSVFYSIKRGAIVSLILSIVVYYSTILYMNKNLKSLGRLFIGVLVTTGIGYLSYLNNFNFYIKRFEDTSGSGRDKLYERIYDAWLSSDLINIIFGFGTNQTQVFTGGFNRDSRGIYAHSDWLQFLYDYGLVGVFLILFLHIYIIRLIRIGFKTKNSFTPILVATYVILFLVNIYSGQLIFANHMIFFSILLALSSYYIYKPKLNFNGVRKF